MQVGRPHIASCRLQHCCVDVVFKHGSCMPSNELLLVPSAMVSTALCSLLCPRVMPKSVLGTPESSPGMETYAVCYSIPCSCQSAMLAGYRC